MAPILNIFASIAKDAPGAAAHATGAAPVGIHMSDTTEESTYAIARILMDCVEWFLGILGLSNDSSLFLVLYAILVFAVAIGIGMVIKWLVVALLNKIGPHVKSDIYRNLVQQKFFTKLCRFIPALLFIVLIQFTLYGSHSLAMILSRITYIYIIVILCSSVSTLVDVMWRHINSRANKRKLPLNGLMQLVKLIIWIIGALIILAVIFNKSPGSLLAGLGAFSAVLMLVFKDNILGVVAGVQLAENDSLHEGDWIVPHGSDANGVVVEVGLTAIKIQNWDKTITTLPPYNLVSQGFRNYRNMQLSQTRRIQRCYMIDADSVVPTDEPMLGKFAAIPLLKNWVEKKIEQRKAGKTKDVNNPDGLADGSLDTNLGVFRAYLKLYLDGNPDISHDDTCFICTLEQTPAGIPLQLYCFTSTSSWLPYEAIQSTVFEHVAAMLSRFNLYTFENPSGRDTIIDGYLSPGKDPAYINGMPYPLFSGTGTPSNPGRPPEGLYPGASLYCGPVHEMATTPDKPATPDNPNAQTTS